MRQKKWRVQPQPWLLVPCKSSNVTVLRTGISHLLLTILCTGRCGFGVSKHVKNNVLHVDDRHILHPLGKHIANYDCSTSEVRADLLFESLASH